MLVKLIMKNIKQTNDIMFNSQHSIGEITPPKGSIVKFDSIICFFFSKNSRVNDLNNKLNIKEKVIIRKIFIERTKKNIVTLYFFIQNVEYPLLIRTIIKKELFFIWKYFISK